VGREAPGNEPWAVRHRVMRGTRPLTRRGSQNAQRGTRPLTRRGSQNQQYASRQGTDSYLVQIESQLSESAPEPGEPRNGSPAGNAP